MKKGIALALALCLVLALTACGKEAPKDQDLLAQIQAKGGNHHCHRRHLGALDLPR